jgi:enediyne biosynthesis protein E4
MKYIFYLFSLGLFFSCKNESRNFTEFSFINSKDSGLDFINKVEDTENTNILTYRNYYNGGGVAIGDINNDGLQDIFFTANMGENKLYLNKGNFKFEDITKIAGVKGKNSWTTGVTFADVNSDGFTDIYVCYSGDSKNQSKQNELYINNGNLTFTEKAKEFGLDDDGLSTHASFFDYDCDGDLDCYVLNNSYLNPQKILLSNNSNFEFGSLGGDRLYKNENGKFIDVTKVCGIFSNNKGFGLGISVGDINNDFFPDIYISNDFWERDYCYVNQQNGTFKESLVDNFSYTSLNSMGSDIADINNDGNLDIFSTDMLPSGNERLKAATKFDDYYLYALRSSNNYHYQFLQNCLQINDGLGMFTETAFFSGLSATDWSWGALIFDMNLDGNKDIFVSNGVYHDITDSDFGDFLADKDQVKKIVEKSGKYDFRDFVKLLPHNKQKNYAFINNGNLKFENQSELLNLNQESFSNGSAYGDLDNDGDMDLVVNNVNQEAFLYRNNASNTNTFLRIDFKGPLKNLNGIGTTVFAYANGNQQVLQSIASRGFQSTVDTRLIFGFGALKKIDSVRVIWPDKHSQLIKNPEINSEIKFDYRLANEIFNVKVPYNEPQFKNVSENTLPNCYHIENKYVDFDFDRLMPHLHSTEGPNIISGDINGDGLIDFILQGAMGSSDQLFFATKTGFRQEQVLEFERTKDFEKTAGCLFDSDNDGDLDYLVGMGGNNFKAGIQSFSSYFFENNDGKFIEKNFNVPQFRGQISCIKAADIDNDGDQDLFVGGRSVPGAYGLIARSFVLINNGKNGWQDQTTEVTGPLGMVTDATFDDINGDKFLDLVVVGEWLPITFIINNKGLLNDLVPVPATNGWWNCIKSADIDQDGDLDFLVGNSGLNFKLKASVAKPLTAFVGDFDNNSRPDFILNWYTQDDKLPFPFASKQDLTAQLPFLKKTSLLYHDYAKKQVEDLFKKSDIEQSLKLNVDNFESGVLVNNKGNFEFQKLPDAVQMSRVYCYEVADFNKDGIVDIYFGGNFYGLKPEMGRNDGFKGGYLKGLGKGQFQFVDSISSGLIVKGQQRDAKIINGRLVVAINDDKTNVFEY